MLAEDADIVSVDRSLEAYFLWLFGCIMFNNTHEDSVDKVLMGYAREIADAADEDVPTWSWGSAVLAATYRGLCDACSKVNENAILTGCPLLLQLWAYERFAVDQPIVNHTSYEPELYGEVKDDRPTMGTLWCSRQVRMSTLSAVIHFDNNILYHSVMLTNLQRTWAHVQARRVYPVYVWELDQLSPDDVVWEPYSVAAVASRAPHGLSSLCMDNQGLWMTTTAM